MKPWYLLRHAWILKFGQWRACIYALAFTWVVVTTIVKYDLLEGACANHGLGRAGDGREGAEGSVHAKGD